MKKLKLNFQNLENAEVLTREQLKQIMGGDDPYGSGGSGGEGSGGLICKSDACSVYDSATGETLHGNCDGSFVFVTNPLGGSWVYKCYCHNTRLGYYNSTSPSVCNRL